jgi:glycosyltransferase involved in cell wall biosynthesis
MAAGTPCIASDCDGNRSLVAEGRTGLLFDAHRPDELAAQLDRVLSDADLAAGLAAAAREQVTSRYDLGALVATEIALLKRLARPG